MPSDEPLKLKRRHWLGRVAGLALGVVGAWKAMPALANELKLGAMAPPLVLHSVDGRNISSRELLGQVVVITFWATWCAPCREELPHLSAFAKQHDKQGLSVLAFSLDEPEQAQNVKAIGSALSFPVGLLGSQYAGGYGRIWRMPVCFVIDRQGRLAHNGWDHEPDDFTQAHLERLVLSLLAS